MRDEWSRRFAHRQVRRAIQTGAMVRYPCERCNHNVVDAHHEDYAYPLEVTWLCRSCHKLRHAELKAAGLDHDYFMISR